MSLVNPRTHVYSGKAAGKICLTLFLFSVARFAAAGELTPSCVVALAIDSPIRIAVTGAAKSRRAVPVSRSRVDAYAIEEDGVDVFVRALDAADKPLAIFDNPIARNGVHIVPAYIDGAAVAALELEGKEHKELRGRVFVSSLNLEGTAISQVCAATLEGLSRADRDYGAAQAFKLRRASTVTIDSNALLARSRDSYRAARRRVAGVRVHDTAAIEAMLAALSYFNLDAWLESADWASAASINFGRWRSDYAAARAKSVLASAWLEIATQAVSSSSSYEAPQKSVLLMNNARDLLRELERFFQSRQDTYFAALQTNNLGLSYYYQAEFATGLPYFRRAEQTFRRIAELQRAGLALQNIALCDWGQGRLTAAISGFRQALDTISPTSEPQLYALAANNLGLVSYAAGKYDLAQLELSRAYEAAETSQVETFRARALYGLAITQYALGDKESVEELLESVLQIWTPQLDARGRVAALRALAVVKRGQGSAREALRFNREALALAAAPSARGRILLDIAESESVLGDAASALKILQPIADRDDLTDRLLNALARMTRGSVLRALGKYESALKDLRSALPVFRELEDINAEFRCLLELARLSDSSGDRNAAVSNLEQALDLTDEIRSQTTNPEYRASLASSLREAQELLLSIYWRDYRKALDSNNLAVGNELAIRALTLADSLRGAVLAELRSRDLAAHSSRQVSEANLLRGTLRQLAELRYQLAVRYDRAGSDDKAAMRLRAKIAELRARLGTTSTGVAATKSTMNRRLVQTERRLRALGTTFSNHAFIEYWLGDKYAFAWLLRHGRVEWLELGAPKPLRLLAVDYSKAMSNAQLASPASQKSMLEKLHRALLTNLIPLLGNAKELVIVPDGPLALVSFGTLRDPNRPIAPYLAQRLDISIAPALGIVATRNPRDTEAHFRKDLLLVADPVYETGDPRFRDGAADQSASIQNRSGIVLPGVRKFRRLVWSGTEAEAIARLLAPDRIDRLTGFEAHRGALAIQDLRAYRFLHFAVHATTDYEIPQLSAVILSQFDRSGRVLDSEWRSGDFAELGIQAEAIVLSACSSAAGRNIAGEGVLGLQYAALAGGARAVIATYWEVRDEITAKFMTETYRRMLSGKDSPSLAVGYAIRNLLQIQPELGPELWGAFATYIILPREPKMKG
jgi:CHAT domain-containing protein